MIDRYPAPNATHIFSEQEKIRRWTGLTKAFAEHSIATTDGIDRATLFEELGEIDAPTPGAVATRERSTGHDVVAFLSLFTQDMSPALKRHIHYGMTSSDLVDNAHFSALRHHAYTMHELCHDLTKKLRRWEDQATTRAGRTHGQIAAPTSWNHQLSVMYGVIVELQKDFLNYSQDAIVKSMGPTGVTPLVHGRDHEIAKRIQGRVVPSTQVIPRDYQLRWAALYLRLAGVLENLALLVRLGARSEVGEIQEGAAANRVGSSAMPHKRNPIDSEKVYGLVKVARGYFSTLAENVALWEDRDLSNSSIERIAVPGLAATVEHMLLTMTRVMGDLQVDLAQMSDNACDSHTATNIFQVLAQKHFLMGPVEAGKLVRDHIHFGFGNPGIDMADIISKYHESEYRILEWSNEARRVWRSALGVGEGPESDRINPL